MRSKPWHIHLLAALALAVAAFLSGCGSDTLDGASRDFEEDSSSPGHPATRGFTANYDLTRGIVPSANNLLFSGSQDGTLNIPIDPDDPAAALKQTLNALDGFSTVAPFSTTFSAAIDPASLTPSTVRMFEVTLTGIGGAVTGITRELVFGAELVAQVSSVPDPDDATLAARTLVIVPLRPLKPKTSYLVALTEGIRSTDGRSAMAADNYLTAKTVPHDLTGTPAGALEPVRRLVQAQETALEAFGMDPEPVVLSWTLTTQSAGDVLSVVRNVTPAAPATALFPAGAPTPLGAADIYVGTLEVPYYLAAASGPDDPAPLQGTWRAQNEVAGERNLTWLNPLPEARSPQTIPLMLTVPRSPKPEGGWRVVIFQHGITRNRTDVLGIADALAGEGFAAVSIDLPLHGLTPSVVVEIAGNDTLVPNPLYPLFGMSDHERTFGLDLVDNIDPTRGPDGETDSSGTHFINLSSLLTLRDNLRQGAADLFALVKALEDMDYDGDGNEDFDPAEVYFLGHSLGGIVGTPFLALEPGVRSAVLAMPGGGIAKLTDGSKEIGERIEAGLARAGLVKGEAPYESFMAVAQTALDSADPLNHATGAVSGRGMLLYEVLGDEVIPNNLLTNTVLAPKTVPSVLAGTDPLIRAMGLTQVGETTPAEGLSSSPLRAWLGFTAGDHGSLLDPAANAAVTQVMQAAAATFFSTDGGRIVISDPSVVLAP
ncbi:MAG: lipase [Deferrisomatales bacterium]